MAYKFSTGSVSVGDLSSKDDPGTEIDFEDNLKSSIIYNSH